MHEWPCTCWAERPNRNTVNTALRPSAAFGARQACRPLIEMDIRRPMHPPWRARDNFNGDECQVRAVCPAGLTLFSTTLQRNIVFPEPRYWIFWARGRGRAPPPQCAKEKVSEECEQFSEPGIYEGKAPAKGRHFPPLTPRFGDAKRDVVSVELNSPFHPYSSRDGFSFSSTFDVASSGEVLLHKAKSAKHFIFAAEILHPLLPLPSFWRIIPSAGETV